MHLKILGIGIQVTMNKYAFLFILVILPFQAFCDRYWISSLANVNADIKTIESGGGIVKDVKATRISDCLVSYTIVYRSGEDLKAEKDARSKIYKK